MNDPIVTTASSNQDICFELFPDKHLVCQVKFDNLLMTPGKYWLTVSLREDNYGIDQVVQACILEISSIAYPNQKPFPDAWGYVQYAPVWQRIESLC